MLEWCTPYASFILAHTVDTVLELLLFRSPRCYKQSAYAADSEKHPKTIVANSGFLSEGFRDSPPLISRTERTASKPLERPITGLQIGFAKILSGYSDGLRTRLCAQSIDVIDASFASLPFSLIL